MGIDIELYSVSEVARKLQVSDETIYRWLKSGNLKAIKLGGQWRIKESELRRLLEELEEEVTYGISQANIAKDAPGHPKTSKTGGRSREPGKAAEGSGRGDSAPRAGQ